MSSDSAFENPFREGGKLSTEAEVIIDALKTGRLSVMSNTGGGVDNGGHDEHDKGANGTKGTNSSGVLVQPRERKNADVDVQRGLVVNAKTSAVERVVIPDEKKKKCSCCVLQ